jgi:Right handed beta helix region
VLMATAGALLLSATSASALTCGQELKRDIKLRKNLNCSTSSTDGFEIAKHGVEIDLNGHRLIGDDSYYGIDNSDGYDRLVVKNGRLDGWIYGVYGYNGSQSQFRSLRINLGATNSGYGLYLQYGVQTAIKNVTVDNASYGLYLNELDRLRIEKAKVTGSNPSSTYGIYGGYLAGKIEKVRANGANYGVYLYGESPGVRIEDSTANNTGFTGFYMSNSTPLSRYRYTLVDNTAKNADQYGFYASYDTYGGGNKATGAGTQNCYNVPCGG